LALKSRNPDTAQTRFELAVEAYHQLNTLPLTPGLRASLHSAMCELADQVPSQICGNQVLGMMDKANQYKTVKRQIKTLRDARLILERGILADDVGRDGLNSLLQQVNRYLAQAEAMPDSE